MSLRCKTCDKFDGKKKPELTCRCGSAPRKWQGDLWIAGRRRHVTPDQSMTPREARAWYTQLKQRREEVKLPSAKHTFAEAADSFLTASRDRLDETADEQIRASTFESIEGHVRLHLVPYFGPMQLRTVTLPVIEQFRRDLRKGCPRSILEAKVASFAARLREGKFAGDLESRLDAERERIRSRPLSADTIRKALLNLQRVLGRAKKLGWIDSNPAAELEKTKRKRTRKVGIALTAQETSSLDAELDTEHPRHRLPMRLSIQYGVRRGEAIAFQWADWDEKEATLIVRRSIRAGRVEEPKTEAGVRVIPLTEELNDELRAWRREAPIVPGGWMFPARSNDGNWHGAQGADNFARAWKRVRQRFLAKREDATRRATLDKFRYHDTRHTAITNFKRRGLDPKVTRLIVGHADEEITEGVYTHLAVADIRAALAKTAASPLRMSSADLPTAVSG